MLRYPIHLDILLWEITFKDLNCKIFFFFCLGSLTESDTFLNLPENVKHYHRLDSMLVWQELLYQFLYLRGFMKILRKNVRNRDVLKMMKIQGSTIEITDKKRKARRSPTSSEVPFSLWTALNAP